MVVLLAGCGGGGGGAGAHDPGECPPPSPLGTTWNFCETACVSDDRVEPPEDEECTTEKGTMSGVFAYDGVSGACEYTDAAIVFHECLDQPIRVGCEPIATIADNFNDGHVLFPRLDHLTVRAGAEKTFVLRGNGLPLHEHQVTITAADFAKLDRYEPISETSTVTNGHSHVVAVKCFGK